MTRPPVTLRTLAEKKAAGEPIVMVTAYDYPSARAAERAEVDMVLVGDSGAQVVLGYGSTVEVTTDEMLVLARPFAAALSRRSWCATCRSARRRSPTSRPSRRPSDS